MGFDLGLRGGKGSGQLALQIAVEILPMEEDKSAADKVALNLPVESDFFQSRTQIEEGVLLRARNQTASWSRGLTAVCYRTRAGHFVE